MALKFKSKPKRITRELARELARKAIAYYKANKGDGNIMRVFLEYEIANPNKYRIIVDKERDRRYIPEEIFRNGLVYLPTSEEYNLSKNKPTQKNLEDLIYNKGNQQLSQLHKINLRDEFLYNYVHKWTEKGIAQPDVPVKVVFRNKEGVEDVIYQGALADDIFVMLNEWYDSLENNEELEGVTLSKLDNNSIRREIHDGNRNLRVAMSNDLGEVWVGVGVNKYGEEIDLNNYIY